MAIQVREQMGRQSGSITVSDEYYTRHFYVMLDELSSNGIQIATQAVAAFLGISWDYRPTYPGRTDLFLMSLTASQEGVHPKYLVEAKYSVDEYDAPELAPWQRACKINWNFRPYQTVVSKDLLTGEVITNSAGELYVPPIEESIHHPTCVVVRNELDFSPSKANTYMNSVNADYFTLAGYPVGPGYALMRNLGANRAWWRGIAYSEVTYEIELNSDTWITQVLDQGTYYLDKKGNQRLFRTEGEPSDRPHNLNGSGGQLPSGSSPVFLGFITKTREHFGNLLLPVSMDDPGFLI